MNKYIRKNTESKWLPFISYGAIMILFHVYISYFMGDDVGYVKLAVNESFEKWCNFLVERYQEWSSRIVIDGVMILLVHNTLLWKILDTILMLWIAIAFSKFFNRDNRTDINWYIVLTLLTFPMWILRTAGWISTSVNYSWPFAFGLLGMWPIKNMIFKEKNRWYNYVLGIVGILFATSQEQMCAVVFALSIIFLIFLYMRDKKIYGFVLLETLLSTFFMGVILTCPGNAIRKAEEIVRWFPEYPELSLWRKLELGYSSTLYKLVMESNLVFTLFTAFLVVTVFAFHKDKILRLIAVIPFAISIIFGMFAEWFEPIFPNLLELRNAMTQIGTGIVFFNPLTWIPDFFITMILLCVCISLWVSFKDNISRCFSFLILALGFATRWVMCFSPTIWASSDRTYTFLYMALIVNSILLIKRYKEAEYKNGNINKFLWVVVGVSIIFIADSYLYSFKHY